MATNEGSSTDITSGVSAQVQPRLAVQDLKTLVRLGGAVKRVKWVLGNC